MSGFKVSFLQFFNNLKKIALRYRVIIIIIFAAWTLWFLGIGALTGWFLSKGSLDRFPDISDSDRILIIAPHIDDEAISTGGIIQEALKNNAEVRIIYMTNGDDNLTSVIKVDKTINVNPNEFIALGEKRMSEGEKATGVLGLAKENLYFLGYPDRGLYLMFNKYYNPGNPYTSQGTKFDFNPYSGTYKSQQPYTGSNVVSDLVEIIKGYNPTMIFVSHPRDVNRDHRATYLFLEKALFEANMKVRVFAYLVHYTKYPPKKSLSMNEYLYPPQKLFTQKGWYSFNLSTEQENIKLEAVKKNISQEELGKFYDLLQSFVKRNEIFEEM